jgi:hypothetical protein
LSQKRLKVWHGGLNMTQEKRGAFFLSFEKFNAPHFKGQASRSHSEEIYLVPGHGELTESIVLYIESWMEKF